MLCDAWSRNKVVSDKLLPGRMSSIYMDQKFSNLIQFVNPNDFRVSSINDDLKTIEDII